MKLQYFNMRILHITNWFPNRENPGEAVWIKRHIELLSEETNEVIHFQIKPSGKLKFLSEKEKGFTQRILHIPVRSWLITEILCFFWLFWKLVVLRMHKKYDIINFHIAYPLLTYWHLMKKFVNTPVVITEHWSAYHFNFGVDKSLRRIQRIFKQNIPLIAVSKTLLKSIKKFASSEFPGFILPNVVNENIFFKDAKTIRGDEYFMVSYWKEPKDPFIAMETFLKFNKEGKYKLNIGGYGPQWEVMEEWVEEKGVLSINLLGRLTSEEIASLMRSCKAFLHPSNYETFSVVCAEAVCCGALVIAPAEGAIPEVVGENGILIDSNTRENWQIALKDSLDFPYSSLNKVTRFYQQEVKTRYIDILNKIINDSKR